MSSHQPPPPGSDQIGLWAYKRNLPYQPTPEPDWYRAWEPFLTMVSPARYHNAVQCPLGSSQVVLAEPWAAVGDLEPLGRTLMAFVTHGALRYRAAARIGGSHLTRVSFLGSAPPRQQSTGDTEWDNRAITFADTPLEAVRAFTPSLRKLLLGWDFEGHIEIRPGGLVFHLATSRPIPSDYERLLAWMPMVLDKANKHKP
jgi:hypothetical protein